MTGLAGIGYQLLRCAEPEKVPSISRRSRRRFPCGSHQDQARMIDSPDHHGDLTMDPHRPALPPRPGSFKEANEAWKAHDYQRTIRILTAASKQQPANAKLLLNLGEAYGLRYEYQRAEECFDQAVKVASNPTETLADAAVAANDSSNQAWPIATSGARRSTGC